MTQTIAFSPIALYPTDGTGKREPYVNPIFEGNFRTVERLLQSALAIEAEAVRLPFLDWDNTEDFQSMAHNFELRLQLELLLQQMPAAKQQLESSLSSLYSIVDARSPARGATCVPECLKDGVKLNIIKARGLIDALTKLMQRTTALLESTSQAAAQARTRLTEEAINCLYGRSESKIEFLPAQVD